MKTAFSAPFSRPDQLLLAVLTVLWLFQLGASRVSAQSADDVIKRETVGPFKVTVLARPKEPQVGRGGPRITVEVRNATDDSLINDASVIVAMDRPDGVKAGEIELARNLAVPGIYEARVSVIQTGEWKWAIAVSSSLGSEVVNGTMKVVAGPSAGLRGTLGWFGLLLALIVLVTLAWRSLRPPKQQAGAV